MNNLDAEEMIEFCLDNMSRLTDAELDFIDDMNDKICDEFELFDSEINRITDIYDRLNKVTH